MKRRDMLVGATATAGISLAARSGSGQARPKTLRVGLVSVANPRSRMPFSALDARLGELGYVEGQNFTLDFINLEGRVAGMGEAMQSRPICRSSSQRRSNWSSISRQPKH
jgi:putative ABC transport system substrate-binding protein